MILDTKSNFENLENILCKFNKTIIMEAAKHFASYAMSLLTTLKSFVILRLDYGDVIYDQRSLFSSKNGISKTKRSSGYRLYKRFF